METGRVASSNRQKHHQNDCGRNDDELTGGHDANHKQGSASSEFFSGQKIRKPLLGEADYLSRMRKYGE